MIENIFEQKLRENNVLLPRYPSFIEELGKTIANDTIPSQMKAVLAVSELVLYASQFRRNILHWNGSSIPINAITFCISASGTGKDSSINLLRKNFHSSYKILEEFRDTQARNKAIEIAKSKNKAKPTSYEAYKEFYDQPIPLRVAPSTTEGYIQYLNEIEQGNIGAGYIFSSEIGAELSNSKVISSNFQLISELYDEGKKEVKVLKAKENQSKEIRNLPVSALFMGSSSNILYDSEIKKQFKMEFSSKLARRSFFYFSKEETDKVLPVSIDDFLARKNAIDLEALKLRENFDRYFLKLSASQFEKLGKPITVSQEVINLFNVYKEYNEIVSKSILEQYPISKIVRMHLQWKALKLSGAFAIYHNRDEIQIEDYVLACNYCELLDGCMQEFERELNKEPYEVLADYMHQSLVDNRCFLDIHTLKKLGFISGTSNLEKKLKEIVILVSSYDLSGIYKALENGIEYTELIKTNVIGISYLPCTGTKAERAKKCSTGFVYSETSFEALADMLKGDYAYSPFQFKNGIRSKENLVGDTKWLALDIDHCDFTYEQIHTILGNINHHIVQTSDKKNLYKFRLLVELDSPINLPDREFKTFVQSVSQYLGLSVDLVPKSQIFFSYANREILSVTNAKPLEVRSHLLIANDSTNEPFVQKVENLTKAQLSTLLNNPTSTFVYAYEAKQGEGSLNLYRAAKHAKDLGMTKEQIVELIEDINNYWEYPMDHSRLENTILNQIRSWK